MKKHIKKVSKKHEEALAKAIARAARNWKKPSDFDKHSRFYHNPAPWAKLLKKLKRSGKLKKYLISLKANKGR